MKTIRVEICMGTTCYVMGSSALANIANELPGELRNAVEVVGSHCLKACSSGDFDGAPYARVDGELIASATKQKLIEAIERRLQV